MACLKILAHELLLLSCLAGLLLVVQAAGSNSSSPTATISKSCFPPDLAALQALAASFNSTLTPFFRTHWRPQVDCCSWVGVACSSSSASASASGDSRVVGLSLVDTGLQGPLPRAICGLSALSFLDLSSSGLSVNAGNSLYGPIPSCIGHNLTSLQRLLLAYNNLNSSIPQSFSLLSRLQDLDLSSNRDLSGSISPIANLSQLKSLMIASNQFNGTLPFFNTPRLRYLNAFANSFSGALLPAIITNTPSLQYLDVSVNSLSGPIPPFNTTPRLQHLDVGGNSLSGPIPPFNTTPRLQYLNAYNNRFYGALLPAITNTPSLQYLTVGVNSLSGPIPPFNTTPELQVLDLSSNQWTGDIPSLPHLRHLEELYLDDTSLSAQASSISQLFCDLRSLQYLSVIGSTNQDDRSKFPDIDSKHGSTHGTLPNQLHCERPSSVNLTHLDLSSNNLMGPFPAWIGLFSNLQYLDLSSNNFSGSIPQTEWQSLTQLSFLQLSSNSPAPHPLQQLGGWLFRLPLQTLTLRSLGLTTQDFQCNRGLSLLNQTLKSLDLSDNHLSAAHSIWNCLAQHNFTSLSNLYLTNNPVAFNVSHYQPLSQKLYLLDLSYCQLFGNLTMELLSSAEVLYLSHNELSGNIPSQIDTLDLLSWLDLSFNNLTGHIPASLGNVVDCSGFELNNNHLDGEIPTQELLASGEINQLTVLLLEHNHFSRMFFQTSSSKIELYYLRILDLSFNKLEGSLQEVFGDYSVLYNLNILLLSHNQLTGSIPASLASAVPSLTVIELSNNNLTGAIPESLGNLSALRTGEFILSQTMNHFNLQSVKNVKFRGSRLLGYLDLSSNMLSGSIPAALGELVWLNDLNLSRNHFSGPIPSNLANLTHLESLDLSYNDLQGSIPTTLSQISGLAVFNVSFNPKLSGQIPEGPQLQTEDSYKGDPNLCGVQIHKNCFNKSNHDQEFKPAATSSLDHHGSKNIVLQWIEQWVSVPGICLGYAFGIGLTVWALNRIKFYR